MGKCPAPILLGVMTWRSCFTNVFKIQTAGSAEPPVSVRADPRPLYRLWRQQYKWSSETLSANLCRVKRSFKPYQNKRDSVKDTGENGEKPCNIDRKIFVKSCSTTHLPFLSFPLILRSWERSLKRFSPKWSVLNPQQKKKLKQEKRKVKVNQSNRNFAFCACPNYAS